MFKMAKRSEQLPLLFIVASKDGSPWKTSNTQMFFRKGSCFELHGRSNVIMTVGVSRHISGVIVDGGPGAI